MSNLTAAEQQALNEMEAALSAKENFGDSQAVEREITLLESWLFVLSNAEGAREEGLTLLADAAEREDTMGDDFGPPVVVEPAHELYGNELLRAGRAADAAKEFAAALKRAPNRRLSLEGLAKAKG